MSDPKHPKPQKTDSEPAAAPDDSKDTDEATDCSASYRRFALVAFAGILGYGTVADAEAAALRVFPSNAELSLNVSITIPTPPGPTQGNTTCTQGTDEGNCSGEGSCGSNC